MHIHTHTLTRAHTQTYNKSQREICVYIRLLWTAQILNVSHAQPGHYYHWQDGRLVFIKPCFPPAHIYRDTGHGVHKQIAEAEHDWTQSGREKPEKRIWKTERLKTTDSGSHCKKKSTCECFGRATAMVHKSLHITARPGCDANILP